MNVRDEGNENTSKDIVKLIKALIGTNSSSMAFNEAKVQHGTLDISFINARHPRT